MIAQGSDDFKLVKDCLSGDAPVSERVFEAVAVNGSVVFVIETTIPDTPAAISALSKVIMAELYSTIN